MILLDVLDSSENEASSSKTMINGSRHSTSRRPDSFAASENDSVRRLVLPDYATSQALAEQTVQQQQKQDRPQYSTKKARWRRKRFWQAVLVAFALYLVVSACIAVPLIIKLRRPPKDPPYIAALVKSSLANRFPLDVVTLPSTKGHAFSCSDWIFVSNGSSPYFSVNYSIPTNETLTLQSNLTDLDDVKLSQQIMGSLVLDVSSNSSQKEGLLSVALQGGDPTPVSACLMRTGDGWGLAIYIPEDTNKKDIANIRLQVSLILPPATASTQRLTSITTALPAFNQTFSNLGSFGRFDSFVAIGSVGEVNIDSVSAKTLLVQNSVGNITGTFNASESLVLETVLASISANVSLHNSAYYNCPPTILVVETGNSDVSLNVTLYDGASSYALTNPAPSFFSDIRTFGGSLKANFFHDNSSRPSYLVLNAHNNLEPAQVFLDSKFQGTYNVHTTLSDAVVDRTDNVTDPLGLSRTRLFEDDVVSSNRMLGWIGWGSRPQDAGSQGHFEVVSSLSPAILQLTEAPDSSRLVNIPNQPSLIS